MYDVEESGCAAKRELLIRNVSNVLFKFCIPPSTTLSSSFAEGAFIHNAYIEEVSYLLLLNKSSK